MPLSPSLPAWGCSFVQHLAHRPAASCTAGLRLQLSAPTRARFPLPGVSVCLDRLDPGFCHYCPQPLSPGGRDHSGAPGNQPFSPFCPLPACILSVSVSLSLSRTLVLQGNKRFIKPLQEAPTSSSSISAGTIPAQIQLPVLAQYRSNF